MIRPALARMSSAASGLRFCGMIDEPVVNWSRQVTNRNCAEHHSTISSASRDRCVAPIAHAEEAPPRNRGPTPHPANCASAGRSRAHCAVASRSIGKDVPASAAAPKGDSLMRAPRIAQATAIATEHLDVGEEMMSEGDRLRRLEMGEARHDGSRLRSALRTSAAEVRQAPTVEIDRRSRADSRRKSVATWSLRERAV